MHHHNVVVTMGVSYDPLTSDLGLPDEATLTRWMHRRSLPDARLAMKDMDRRCSGAAPP